MSAPTIPGWPTEGVAGDLTALGHAHWPYEGGGDTPPTLAGFVASPFGPIIADAADRCLREHYGEPPAPPARGERTAVILVTRYGDMATEAAVTGSVDDKRPASPLLFFQSVPSAVLGIVASRWGLGGPVVVISPAGDPLADAVVLADLVIEDGNADEALLLIVDLATGEDERDRAEAILVAPREVPAGRAR